MAFSEKIKRIITSQSESTPKQKNKRKKAKIISVCSQKGGVGKTTTAVNLGTAIAKFYKKRVLVIDLDPQGHVEKSLGSIVEEGIDYTPLSNILLSKNKEILDAVVQTDLQELDITPGDKDLYETEGMLTTKLGREFILTDSFATAKSVYDFIIIDCPPNLGNLTINALCASDHVLIPCEMSVLAFEGVSDLLDTLDTISHRLNSKLSVLGVLFTRVDGRNVQMNQLVEENMKKQFKGKIFKSKIAINTDLNKAQLEGVPVFDFSPSSSGSTNYQELSKEIMKRLQPTAKMTS